MSHQTGIKKQLKVTDIFRVVPSSATNLNGSTTTLVRRVTSSSPEGPEAKKQRLENFPPDKNPYHSSHQFAKLGLHYVKRSGMYYCEGPASRKPELNGICDFNTDKSTKITNHSQMCWPNLHAIKKIKENTAPNKRERGRKSATKYRNSELEKLKIATEKGESPTYPCSFDGCNTVVFTQLQLSQHTSRMHKGPRTLDQFLQSTEFSGLCLPENHKEDLSDTQMKFDDFLNNRRKNHFNFAYLVIFLHNVINSVDDAWEYIESNANNSTLIIPFYAGKGTCDTPNFLVEEFHKSSRDETTVFKYIKENKMRAYQLIAIPLDSDDAAASQEAIFQKIGWLSSRKDPRQNSINYSIINQRAEMKNWTKLSKKDSDRAFDLALQRQPLLCLDKKCQSSHQAPGEFCFGKFHRNEVNLIPFDYDQYL